MRAALALAALAGLTGCNGEAGPVAATLVSFVTLNGCGGGCASRGGSGQSTVPARPASQHTLPDGAPKPPDDGRDL